MSQMAGQIAVVLAALAGLLLPSVRRPRQPAEGDAQMAVVTRGAVATDQAS